jgi:1-acyl-sn-glycerol-3-phosphate acyltransferase
MMRRLLASTYLKLYRWKCVPPPQPLPDRCVVIAYPHTTNWDFPVTLALAVVTGIDIKWLGKRQLFRGPMGPVMRKLGGISVERTGKQGMVASLADEFTRRNRLALVVPAEGTRSKVEYWKSGFYRIALEANVPIVCAFVDGPTRSGGFGLIVHPSGDVKADMDIIRAFYAGRDGIRANKTAVPRLREEDEGLAATA